MVTPGITVEDLSPCSPSECNSSSGGACGPVLLLTKPSWSWKCLQVLCAVGDWIKGRLSSQPSPVPWSFDRINTVQYSGKAHTGLGKNSHFTRFFHVQLSSPILLLAEGINTVVLIHPVRKQSRVCQTHPD